MKLKELKKGEFFTKKPIEYPTEKQVFVRGEYDRTSRKYEVIKWNDINAVSYMNGEKEVYTNLVF